jgi:two-component system, chemotaxis family, CheB/CheR fusion protein
MATKKHSTSEPVSAPSANAGEISTPSPGDKGLPIVGIGASAGGLAAFEAFLSAMPADAETGMAFVLVQHL